MDVETLDTAQTPEPVEPAVVENELDTQDKIIDLDEPNEDEPVEVEAEQGEAEIEGEGDGEELAADEPEFATIEFEGEEYDVPPALKDAFMRNKDYTQKNQARAERERVLDERETTLQQREQLSQAEISAMAERQQIESDYANYAELSPDDWNALEAEDPIGAQKHWRNFQLLEKQWNVANSKLAKAQQEKQALAQSDQTKRLEAVKQHAQKNIPGWNEQMDAEIRQLAQDRFKLNPERFDAGVNEYVYDALHLAWVGAKALETRAKAASATAKLKPSRQISAKSSKSVAKDPSDMSMSEYKKWADAKYKDT